MSAMNLWSVEPPKQWRAGWVGSGANERPIYFACADCGLKDAPIAGIVSTDGTYAGIGLLPGPDKGCPLFLSRPAMFCAGCFAKRGGVPVVSEAVAERMREDQQWTRVA